MWYNLYYETKESEAKIMGLMMKSKSNLINSVAELKDADYSKNPQLGDIYKRLAKGRQQFEAVMDKDIQAVMEISALELALNQHTDSLIDISSSVADETTIIHKAAEESSLVASQVNEQHEDLTKTIVSAAEDTNEVHQKIEAGQNELSEIKNLSNDMIKESSKYALELFKQDGIEIIMATGDNDNIASYVAIHKF